MDIREDIKAAIARACEGVGVAIEAAAVPLEHTDDFAHGDYASGIALKEAKAARVPPRALAESIVAALPKTAGVERVEVAGAGFINFHCSREEIARALEEARSGSRWGMNRVNAGTRIMIEYTDPNPFKQFHIGHLMSNAIGESIARLLDFSGAEVKRANYQGDVGPHVAKAIWAMQKKGYLGGAYIDTIGAFYAEGSKAYEDDQQAKVEIDDINKKIYDRSDRAINALYDLGKGVSLEHFEEIYKILGTAFDFYFFESKTAPIGEALVREHADIFAESEGAIVYRGEDEGLHTRVFITGKGIPTYEAKELGLAELKADTWSFDSSITITAHEQADYFDVVLSAMRRVLPEIAAKISHISHGMMRFLEGKMSSRTGNVITGELLLKELKEAALERAAESRASDAEQLAEDIAVGAIKYQILRQASGKDIIFDRERALSLDGDSGPYLQYSHARAQQVLERARQEGVAPAVDADAEPIALARLIHRFPEVAMRAAAETEPHLVANFLIEFAALFNRWYAEEKILDGTPAAAHKAALADAARATLKNGLWLLGIAAPEKM